MTIPLTKRRTYRRKKHRYKTYRRRQKGGTDITVTYNGKQVSGQAFTKAQTISQPSITFSAAPSTTDNLYTLVMWDPDVPDQFQPGWAHWIAINLRSPNNIQDNLLLDYSGPSPPSGTHRYYFGLFEQQGRHISPRQPSRQGFDIRKFVADNRLKDVSTVYMTVKHNA